MEEKMEKIGYALLAAGICAGDLRIKDHIEKTAVEEKSTPILKGKVLLRRCHNYGAFLNLGENHSALVRALSALFAAGAAGAFAVALSRREKGLTKFGCSLLFGGALSNTWDRLSRRYVVDYFSFVTGIEALDRIVFNLADFAILTGAAAVVLAEGKTEG